MDDPFLRHELGPLGPELMEAKILSDERRALEKQGAGLVAAHVQRLLRPDPEEDPLDVTIDDLWAAANKHLGAMLKNTPEVRDYGGEPATPVVETGHHVLANHMDIALRYSPSPLDAPAFDRVSESQGPLAAMRRTLSPAACSVVVLDMASRPPRELASAPLLPATVIETMDPGLDRQQEWLVTALQRIPSLRATTAPECLGPDPEDTDRILPRTAGYVATYERAFALYGKTRP
jgi:hypothetical protein